MPVSSLRSPSVAALSRRLRSATGREHSALEKSLPIAAGTPTVDIYRDHLEYLLGFHEPMEARLQRVSELARQVPGVARRWKTARLASDLGPWAHGPRAPEALLPPAVTLAGALGVFYVLEGAVLGARTLLPRLEHAGVVPGPVGSSYFAGYGAETASMWTDFKTCLDDQPATSAGETIEAARATFEALRLWRRDWETRRDDHAG